MEIQLEIDSRQVRVRDGVTIMEAAHALGIAVPHFCYHKKLSIAANCRMCLVDVEKAPKPLPACATPAVDGMIVRTCSEKAKRAQHGVMEFLLINHPLDCPICDQGGECPLQDLAVGYGISSSRYAEEKRVVMEKNLGPLISTGMTRCIHCTRCVRFGSEIAGAMELGLSGRGEHAEIMPFVEKTVDSELSGNMIDICPVGALTSKPFRFTARPWELSHRDSISPHDCWGSALQLHTKDGKVLRVVPRENEEVNECWISDRDRFSYEGLNADSRAIRPMLRPSDATQWSEVTWPDALDFTTAELQKIAAKHGADSVGFLASPSATTEELHLFQKFARAFGSPHIDHRLRESDFSADGRRRGIPWLGMKISEMRQLKSALLVGANPSRDLPLLAHRLRQLAKSRGKVFSVAPLSVAGQCRLAGESVVKPSRMAPRLAQILRAARELGGVSSPTADGKLFSELDVADMPDEFAKRVASRLCGSESAIWLGAQARHHPKADSILRLAQTLAETAGARLGCLTDGANAIGAYLAEAIPFGDAHARGFNAAQMSAKKMKGYVLLGCEPEDFADSAAIRRALGEAEFVASLSAFDDKSRRFANAILPIAPFSETSGTFISGEGRRQTFAAAVPPKGESRPGWKVLRVLGNALNLPGFDFESPDEIRAEIFDGKSDIAAFLNNGINVSSFEDESQTDNLSANFNSFERIGDIPPYRIDAIVRRAAALQKTRRSREADSAFMHPDDIASLGISSGEKIRFSADADFIEAEVFADTQLPRGVVRAAGGGGVFESLGELFSRVEIAAADSNLASGAGGGGGG